ncbi:uncharacterized protein YukE [Catenulispora sp. GAS73]|uniref:WXG100 family type VII secretion target n=1 Tax=Catenulispora sp. GAS73 TaxID=3156269 RepID=UPI0035147C00
MGNPDFMNIQYATISDFVTELTAINTAGRQLIEDLTTTLQSNTELWNGIAKLGYNDVHRKWNGQFERMSTILSEVQNHGNQTQELYQEIEAQNISLWGGQ